MSVQRFDIVLWGATGFTGELVAEYLAEHEGVGEDVSWALAGRSQTKLEAVRARVAERFPAAANLPLILADAADPASLRAMAAQAKVVCTTVGPYFLHGQDLVAACVETGTHYCDLTGEAHFIKVMIDTHHEQARAKGVRIVHTCGVDSIPSDLGTFLVQQTARQRLGHPVAEVTAYVKQVRGGASGGTIASMAELAKVAAENRDHRRALAHPYSLLPEGAPKGPPVKDFIGIERDDREDALVTSFLMAAVNAKVVRRSAALLDYGPDFLYRERSAFKRNLRGWRRALGANATLAVLFTALSNPLGRRLVRRVMPSPGDGPDRAKREGGSMAMHVVGRQGEEEVRVIVRTDKDPGYGATAGMIGEAALCLARDDLKTPGGVLTPAAAMGQALIDRLPRGGITFEIKAG